MMERLHTVFTLLSTFVSHTTILFQKMSNAYLLIIRFFVAYYFLSSGLIAFSSWSATVDLFTYEYQVLFVEPKTAAVLMTGAELILPVFLILGLGARLPAFGLLLTQVFTLVFYKQHFFPGGTIYWSHVYEPAFFITMASVSVIYGHGTLSFDKFIQDKVDQEYSY